MNFEALTAIGIFTLLLGIILVIPGLWWARRKAKTLPENASGRKRVTLFGFVYIGLVVSALVVVFSLQYLAPEISGKEKGALVAIALIVALLGEKLANKLGFKVIGCNNDGNA